MNKIEIRRKISDIGREVKNSKDVNKLDTTLIQHRISDILEILED
jgi:hypothetical protein